MSKKSGFHPGKLWLEALYDFEDELHEQVRTAEDDQLKFQDGRLFASLTKRIKANATGKWELLVMFELYQFMTDPSPFPGYDEARRLHGEEMEALGLRSACLFCSSLAKQFAQAPEPYFKELFCRFRSIASWMEAQESFSLWLVFKNFRSGWRGDRDERARAIQALYLSQLPQRLLTKTKHRGRELITARFPDGVRIGTNYEGKPWNDGQWSNILRQAAGLSAKCFDCTELEKWVWWCYPMFRRFGWNTREVLDAVIKRGMDFEKEKAGIDKLITFQKYWIRRGLRFVGGKQKQNRAPLLAEFVEHVVLPEPAKMWGSVGGLLFLPKKN